MGTMKSKLLLQQDTQQKLHANLDNAECLSLLGQCVWLALCCQILSFFSFLIIFFITLGEDKKMNLGKLGMVVLFFYEKWNGGGGAPVDRKNKSTEKNIFLVLGVLDYLFKVGLNVRV